MEREQLNKPSKKKTQMVPHDEKVRLREAIVGEDSILVVVSERFTVNLRGIYCHTGNATSSTPIGYGTRLKQHSQV